MATLNWLKSWEFWYQVREGRPPCRGSMFPVMMSRMFARAY